MEMLGKRPPCWYGESAKKRADSLPVYWSSQRQNLIENCPSCFKKKYIDKIPENPFKQRDKKLIYGYGSVAHAAVELALAGEALPSDAEIAAKAGVQYIDDVKTHVDLLKKKLVVLGLKDAKSEVPFLCYLKHPDKNDSLEIPLYGILDLSKMLYSKSKVTMRMADTKSGTAKWGRAKCMDHYQFKGYAYAGWAATGEIPLFDVISLIKPDKKSGKGARVENQPVDFKMSDLIDFYEQTKIAHLFYNQMVSGEWKDNGCTGHFFCPYK